MEKLNLTGIKGKTLLAIGAHPDDLEFGAGGTLTLLGKANRIVVAVVTSGQMGSRDGEPEKTNLMQAREAEQWEASKGYQARQVFFIKLPDMFVAENARRLRKRLIKILVRVRPDIVITHDPWTEYFPYHPDHRAVGFAVLDAVMASTLPLYLKKKSVSGKALKKRPAVWLMHPHEASHAADISGVYKKKLALIRLHKSQFDGVMAWKEVEEFLDREFGNIGKAIGVKYGEAFRIIQE